MNAIEAYAAGLIDYNDMKALLHGTDETDILEHKAVTATPSGNVKPKRTRTATHIANDFPKDGYVETYSVEKARQSAMASYKKFPDVYRVDVKIYGKRKGSNADVVRTITFNWTSTNTAKVVSDQIKIA